MQAVNIHEAKTHLSRLVKQVAAEVLAGPPLHHSDPFDRVLVS